MRPLAPSVPLLAACLLAAPARAGDAAPAAVLRLADGGYVAGVPGDAPRWDLLRWRGAAFAGPLDFPIAAARAIDWPPAAPTPEPRGDFRVELSGGDVVFGALNALDGEAAELDVPQLGRLRVPRPVLRRLVRRRGEGAPLYSGPRGLDGWTQAPDAPTWSDEAGHLVAGGPGATLYADLKLPARAAVEVELSWPARPDFLLAFGVDEGEASRRDAARIEAFGPALAAVLESRRAADLAELAALNDGPGRVRLRIYVDQGRGRLIVDAADGSRKADLSVAGRRPTALGGVYLADQKGGLRLERLTISPWDGEPPRPIGGDAPRVELADGSAAPGLVTAFDPDAGAFALRGEDGERRIPADQVRAITFPLAADRDPDRPTRLLFQDGTRLSGELTRIGADALEMAVPGLDDLVKAPLVGLRSLSIRPDDPKPRGKEPQVPRLELDGVRLRGRPADGNGADARPIAWQPAGTESAAALRPGASGRIVLKEPPPAKPAPPPPPPAVMAVRAGAVMVARPVAPTVAPARPSAPARPMLYLRSGDVIPATIRKIDEDGAWIDSPVSSTHLVPHAAIKAAVLGSLNPGAARLTRAKRERLLTLPRSQKGSPPTHLVRSRNGDFLRGRVVAMDGSTLKAEVRLESKEVPRDLVAQILWLHADESEPPGPPAPAAGPDGTLRVLAVRGDGVRLGFVLEQSSDDALAGTSPVLGPCRVALGEVDRIVIGDAIGREAARQAVQGWALRDAPEPKPAGDDPGGASGTDSPLVGRAAPDLKLDLLDGTPFRLSGCRGEVVVLDFWATWCGPCLQALPQVERVAGEFQGRGVRLVAVNLQEGPETIRATLQRHKLGVTVALDRDGAAARAYEANAIPQTVIVGRDGKVARLFVGGGPKVGDRLRDALEAALAAPMEPPPGD